MDGIVSLKNANFNSSKMAHVNIRSITFDTSFNINHQHGKSSNV